MPTFRPRYQITETAAFAHAIDLAAQRLPDEPRSKLLLRLIEIGSGSFREDEDKVAAVRREAVVASSGRYADAFGPEYLAELRRDWPA